jgi:hypothetical protein
MGEVSASHCIEQTKLQGGDFYFQVQVWAALALVYRWLESVSQTHLDRASDYAALTP